MARSLTEVIARRRLAVYRRLLLLAVPAALAGCQDGGEMLAPESTGGATAIPAAAPEGLLAAASLDRIAFATSNDIYGMSPTGAGQSRMTSYSGEEIYPIWSPDHGRIAFNRIRDGHFELYLMKADGTNGHWALAKDASVTVGRASWAPDGKSLVAQIYLTSAYVGKIDLASGQWTHLAPLGRYGLQGTYPMYSKDGTWIYYVAPGGKELRRFQPNGSDVLVTTIEGSLSELALSPDGKKIAFVLNVLGNTDVCVLDLATGDFKRVIKNSHQDVDPAWSPNGARLAFASDRSGKFQIYVADSDDGGNLVKLTARTNGAYDPSWYR